MTAYLLPELILVPGGRFLMGSAAGRTDEQPPHEVTVPAFRAARQPVSNAEFARYVEAKDADLPRFAAEDRFNAPDQPVVGVSWFEAAAYCAWLKEETGIPFRLPTEAEREYAALGGLHGVDWPWPGESHLDHPGAAGIATLDRPHVPTPECANGYGLRCMAENVHEWCSDWYDPAWYATSPADAPRGPAEGRRRVNRGGSWRHSVKFTRVTARASLDPGFRYNDFGFRVYADEA